MHKLGDRMLRCTHVLSHTHTHMLRSCSVGLPREARSLAELVKSSSIRHEDDSSSSVLVWVTSSAWDAAAASISLLLASSSPSTFIPSIMSASKQTNKQGSPKKEKRKETEDVSKALSVISVFQRERKLCMLVKSQKSICLDPFRQYFLNKKVCCCHVGVRVFELREIRQMAESVWQRAELYVCVCCMADLALTAKSPPEFLFRIHRSESHRALDNTHSIQTHRSHSVIW